MLYEWACLALQQDARLQALQPVPYVLRDVNAIAPIHITQNAGLQYFAIVIVS